MSSRLRTQTRGFVDAVHPGAPKGGNGEVDYGALVGVQDAQGLSANGAGMPGLTAPLLSQGQELSQHLRIHNDPGASVGFPEESQLA